MWTRAQLKQNAKAALRGRYWMAFLVSLLTGLLAGGSSGGVGGASGGLSGASSMNSGSGGDPSMFAEVFADNPALVVTLVIVVLVIMALAICYTIFVANPILVGYRDYFMENRMGQPGFGRLFSGFNKNYKNIVLTVFLKNLFIGLWSLLFIIPGIIKAYQYYFVEYIMAENPTIEWRRALDLSRQMTNGQKWNIFVLELSFLGWELLGALACGVGTLFVAPYISATMAELYEASREKALYENLTNPQELPGFVLHP